MVLLDWNISRMRHDDIQYYRRRPFGLGGVMNV